MSVRTYPESRADQQAFPSGNMEHGGYEGMTLREWYAGLAMQGLLASFKHDRPENIERWARDSVRIADALIAELTKEAGDE
jgi:hypothetical protein